MNHSKLPYLPYASLRCKDARTRAGQFGYIFEQCPLHPACSRYGEVKQHRLVIEDHIGRLLFGQEVVHHIDMNTSNNHPSNLLLFPNQSMHMRLHQKLRATCYNEDAIERVREAAPDQNVGLKDLGMHPDTAAKICRMNKIDWVNPQHTHLTEDQVRRALLGRTTLEAAEILGCNHQTLRNNWGHLLEKRKSPSAASDPKVIQLVRQAALDPSMTYRSLADLGISSPLAKKICQTHGIEWHYFHRGDPLTIRKKTNSL